MNGHLFKSTNDLRKTVFEEKSAYKKKNKRVSPIVTILGSHHTTEIAIYYPKTLSTSYFLVPHFELLLSFFDARLSAFCKPRNFSWKLCKQTLASLKNKWQFSMKLENLHRSIDSFTHSFHFYLFKKKFYTFRNSG